MEIVSKRGFAYAQYTHHHSEWNAVLRVFDAVFNKRPLDWSAIALLPVRFIVFFPLRSAVRQKAVCIVGRATIADSNIDFPIFRTGSIDQNTGKVSNWFLWNGKKDYKPNLPMNVMRQLSEHGSVDIEYLEFLIDSEWSPEKEWDQRNASSIT